MTDSAVFLDRRCRIIPDEQQQDSARQQEQDEEILSLTELAQQPAFVLLGEPGMGKTESLKALAAQFNGHCIEAQNFILEDRDTLDSAQFYCIDALDEARVKNSSSVLTDILKIIRQAKLSHFCISCRIADWFATDKKQVQYVAPEKSLTLAELLPLSKTQNIRLLTAEGIEQPQDFLNKADELGFADMLGNPQSLKILAAAVKQNNQQWPTQRSEAFELACTSLLREHNEHHKEAQRGKPVSDEDLLDAAGWLCSLMLLSNQATIADTGTEDLADNTLRIESVLDEFSGSHELITTVLQRRVFQKTGNDGGFTPVHRTIAEYLAARYLSKQIEASGLLAGRVAALILASSEHLVSNLRGLAGWLAALSGPMRDRIFAADPAAVLDYGDLYLLSARDKEKLIERLSSSPFFKDTSQRRNNVLRHIPLAQPDMQSFLESWFNKLPESSRKKQGTIHEEAQLLTAAILLDALALQDKYPVWEGTLTKLIKHSETAPYIQRHALPTLKKHANDLPRIYLRLLNEIYDRKLADYEKWMAGNILSSLYPEHLSPAQLLSYYMPPDGHAYNMRTFWETHVEEVTPDHLLPEWMEAIESSLAQGKFQPDEDKFYNNEPNGISAIIVRAIEKFGAEQKAEKLTAWLNWCSFEYESPFSLSSRDERKLLEWKHVNPNQLKAVIAQRMRTIESRFHLADYKIADYLELPEMGAFWLRLSQSLLEETNLPNFAERSAEALSNAFRYLEQHPQKEISLEDMEQTAKPHPALREMLDNRSICKLEKNWLREGWLHKKENEAEQKKLKENRKDDLRQLLGQLDAIRSGENLQFLYHAAWAELHSNQANNNSLSSWILKQFKNHPKLQEATHAGYLSCLKSLTAKDILRADRARETNQVLLIEFPIALGARKLFAKKPEDFLNLEGEILDTLSVLTLEYKIDSFPDWLVALSKSKPERMRQIWWNAYHNELTSTLKKNEGIRLPLFYALSRSSQLTELKQEILTRTLEKWPLKITNQNLLSFADLLIALIRYYPRRLPELLRTRLKKKSINIAQKAYLVMAGMWVAPQEFEQQLQQLLKHRPSSREHHLGFVSYVYKYGVHDKETLAPPDWKPNTIGLFFRLFAPHYPDGAYAPAHLDDGRSFLHVLGEQLLSKPDVHGLKVLNDLTLNEKLTPWKIYFENLLVNYTQALAEKNFTTPTPKQVAQVLQNKKPANQADLMAITLEALQHLQNEIKNSSTNLIRQFWSFDTKKKIAIAPHMPETECRDIIARELSNHMRQQGITLLPELLHGAGNQSDIGLLAQRPNQPDLLLPIEVKGDWNSGRKDNRDLWHAAKYQLYDKYVTDQRTGGNGLYLVLWMGEPNKVAPHPNHPNLNTADALKKALTQQMENLLGEAAKNVKFFVLDLSISTQNDHKSPGTP